MLCSNYSAAQFTYEKSALHDAGCFFRAIFLACSAANAAVRIDKSLHLFFVFFVAYSQDSAPTRLTEDIKKFLSQKFIVTLSDIASVLYCVYRQ